MEPPHEVPSVPSLSCVAEALGFQARRLRRRRLQRQLRRSPDPEMSVEKDDPNDILLSKLKGQTPVIEESPRQSC